MLLEGVPPKQREGVGVQKADPQGLHAEGNTSGETTHFERWPSRVSSMGNSARQSCWMLHRYGLDRRHAARQVLPPLSLPDEQEPNKVSRLGICDTLDCPDRDFSQSTYPAAKRTLHAVASCSARLSYFGHMFRRYTDNCGEAVGAGFLIPLT